MRLYMQEPIKVVIILSRLVATDSLVVEIFLICHVISKVKWSKGYVILWVGASHVNQHPAKFVAIGIAVVKICF